MSDGMRVRLALGARGRQVNGERRRPRWTRALLGLGLGAAMAWGLAGCHKTPPATLDTTVDQNGVDPADANMAPVSGDGSAPAQVLGQNAQYQPQQQGEDYSQQQAAPIERVAPGSGDQSYSDSEQFDPYASDLTDEQATQPPPPLPEYDQPPAPDPDYLWTPGYWAWGPEGYYWVPGAWAAPPYVGALWTGLLGIRGRVLSLPPRLLGTAHRLLRWHRLWLRIRRPRLLRRLLERRPLLLQHGHHPCERQCDSQRLRPQCGCQQCDGEQPGHQSGELQRRQWWGAGTSRCGRGCGAA